jgi:uncharacterized membrane protein
MIALSILLALTLIEIDARMKLDFLSDFPRLFGLGADGSRGMLTAIASSMLTVAALCFSLTLSTISQASAQYTPRILRNFMRDRTNQFILGYFVSIFAYCLVVLRTIRGGDELKFVPSLAVLSGLLLAVGGILVLIYFMHHMASSLQVTNIIKGIESETVVVIDRIFPDCTDETANRDTPSDNPDVAAKINESVPRWYPVQSTATGYVQLIDTDALVKFAVKRDAVLQMQYGIGQFVGEGSEMLKSSVAVEDEDALKLNSYLNIYRYRTLEQDVGYGIRQIVDIALKALSPGVNDTTTAISCIDYLSVIIARLATRTLPKNYVTREGEIRLLIKAPAFHEYLGTAFDQIRISGTGNFAIFLRLLKAYALVAERSTKPDQIVSIKQQMELTRIFAADTLATKYEQDRFYERYNRIMDKMERY